MSYPASLIGSGFQKRILCFRPPVAREDTHSSTNNESGHTVVNATQSVNTGLGKRGGRGWAQMGTDGSWVGYRTLRLQLCKVNAVAARAQQRVYVESCTARQTVSHLGKCFVTYLFERDGVSEQRAEGENIPCGARARRDHDLSQSRMLDRVSHPGTVLLCLKLYPRCLRVSVT